MKYTIIYIIINFLCTPTIYCMLQQSINKTNFDITYAPWRSRYHHVIQNPILSKATQNYSCTLCKLPSSSEYILFRGQHCYITINEQPYVSKGFHLLVIPYEHKKYPHMLTKEVCDEMNILTHSCIKKLSSHSNEIQITSNIGTDATASIPEHLHQHIICTSSERYNNIIDAIRHTSQGINILQNYLKLSLLFSHPPVLTNRITREKKCYYCAVLRSRKDQRNFIIHRSKHATVLFNHTPFSIGDTLVIPNKHYEQIEHIPLSIYAEMYSLMIKTYPLLLTLLGMSDLNISITSYGTKALKGKHCMFTIVPRKGIPSLLPGINMLYIHHDILKLYNDILHEKNAFITPQAKL